MTLQVIYYNKQDECGNSEYSVLENVIYQYDRVSGTLIPFNDPVKEEFKKEKESWKFRDNNFIFKELTVHETNNFEEDLINEMEKAAETYSDILIEDQTILHQHSIEEDVILLWSWWFAIIKYLKWIWLVWVTLCCLCQAYGTLMVLRDYYKRRETRRSARLDSVR